MRKRYEESSKDCFNFELIDDRSTFTLSAKLKAFRSACFSLLLLIITILLLLSLFKTPFKAKTWSQKMIRQEELTIVITVWKNFRAWSNFKNLLRKRAYTRHATGKERSSKVSSRFREERCVTSLRKATKETGSRCYLCESWRLFSESDSQVQKFEWFQSNIKFLAKGERLHHRTFLLYKETCEKL